jgi:hypothetical protein
MNHEIYVYVGLGGKAVEDDELRGCARKWPKLTLKWWLSFH